MLGRFLSTDLEKAPLDAAILMLRVFSGAFIMTHGIPKLERIIDGNFEFGDPIGLGPVVSLILVAFSEVICAGLVIIGLATRWAATPLVITMGVAAFVAHATDPFGAKETPLLFLLIFFVLTLTGSGKYSVDRSLLGTES